jgi:hypothetical protein
MSKIGRVVAIHGKIIVVTYGKYDRHIAFRANNPNLKVGDSVDFSDIEPSKVIIETFKDIGWKYHHDDCTRCGSDYITYYTNHKLKRLELNCMDCGRNVTLPMPNDTLDLENAAIREWNKRQ